MFEAMFEDIVKRLMERDIDFVVTSDGLYYKTAEDEALAKLVFKSIEPPQVYVVSNVNTDVSHIDVYTDDNAAITMRDFVNSLAAKPEDKVKVTYHKIKE